MLLISIYFSQHFDDFDVRDCSLVAAELSVCAIRSVSSSCLHTSRTVEQPAANIVAAHSFFGVAEQSPRLCSLLFLVFAVRLSSAATRSCLHACVRVATALSLKIPILSVFL